MNLPTVGHNIWRSNITGKLLSTLRPPGQLGSDNPADYEKKSGD
jgi:hypothetical protein